MHKRLLLAGLLAFAMLMPAAGVASAHDNSCQDISVQNFHTGNIIGGGTSWSGIQASIDPAPIGPATDGFMACVDSNGLDLVGSSSAWVAIEPGPGNSYYGIQSAILQIGIINCDDLANAVCDPQGSQGLHWFWADGGCGAVNQPLPQTIGSNGNVSSISRTYSVYRSYSSPTVYNYVLAINGSAQVILSRTDGSIGCWIGGPLQFEVSGERKDRGDDFGSISDETKFTNTQRRPSTVTGTFQNVNVGLCEYTDGDTGCEEPGSSPNSFYIYTLGS